jgi:hypothetical protein
MKTATVPAQITTVEDRIAGNLTIQQMALLASPVFIDFALYALLPTMLKLNVYKLILMFVITLATDVLAIRIKSKILLFWAITLLRYNVRPRYYVFNKNNTYLRPEIKTPIPNNKASEAATIPSTEQTVQPNAHQLSQEDVFKLERILANPSTNLSFTTSKKGGLYVSITEVK